MIRHALDRGLVVQLNTSGSGQVHISNWLEAAGSEVGLVQLRAFCAVLEIAF